mmetsp:Transcript_28444/g.70073  ORF Transcript_28444/g.70073 Transcript_28444/m.70073 type:complete len:405 (+) Transcript_28444:285-1499(+)
MQGDRHRGGAPDQDGGAAGGPAARGHDRGALRLPAGQHLAGGAPAHAGEPEGGGQADVVHVRRVLLAGRQRVCREQARRERVLQVHGGAGGAADPRRPGVRQLRRAARGRRHPGPRLHELLRRGRQRHHQPLPASRRPNRRAHRRDGDAKRGDLPGAQRRDGVSGQPRHGALHAHEEPQLHVGERARRGDHPPVGRARQGGLHLLRRHPLRRHHPHHQGPGQVQIRVAARPHHGAHRQPVGAARPAQHPEGGGRDPAGARGAGRRGGGGEDVRGAEARAAHVRGGGAAVHRDPPDGQHDLGAPPDTRGGHRHRQHRAGRRRRPAAGAGDAGGHVPAAVPGDGAGHRARGGLRVRLRVALPPPDAGGQRQAGQGHGGQAGGRVRRRRRGRRRRRSGCWVFSRGGW